MRTLDTGTDAFLEVAPHTVLGAAIAETAASVVLSGRIARVNGSFRSRATRSARQMRNGTSTAT